MLSNLRNQILNSLIQFITNMKGYKYFCNAVLNDDLFFTIYDYLRFHPQVAREYYHILSTDDFDKLTVEDWKDVAEDAIYWLEHDQLPNVYVLKEDDNSPGMDTWGTLYYQTLAYMGRSKKYTKTIRTMELGEIVNVCRDCIEDFKDLRDEIRELNDKDLEEI